MKTTFALLALLLSVSANAQTANPDLFLKSISQQHNASQCPALADIQGRWRDMNDGTIENQHVVAIPNGIKFLAEDKDTVETIVDGSVQVMESSPLDAESLKIMIAEAKKKNLDAAIPLNIKTNTVVACVNGELLMATDAQLKYLFNGGAIKQGRAQTLTTTRFLTGKQNTISTTKLVYISNPVFQKRIESDFGVNKTVTSVRVK